SGRCAPPRGRPLGPASWRLPCGRKNSDPCLLMASPLLAEEPEDPPQDAAGPRHLGIVLVGNPNVGKSALFGALTGTYATVSNYPGTTVEITRAAARFNAEVEIIDTPGVNSLTPESEDERVTR